MNKKCCCHCCCCNDENPTEIKVKKWMKRLSIQGGWRTIYLTEDTIDTLYGLKPVRWTQWYQEDINHES